jgi:enoyl-CoA hydratase
LDLILTGRAVYAKEAMEIGLANYCAPPGRHVLDYAIELAKEIAQHPFKCLQMDRKSVQEHVSDLSALKREFRYGMQTMANMAESQAQVDAFFQSRKSRL